ncbi:MAG: peptidyl-prolyl cis-trans isomerase [Phycisphaerae bacterium]|nr:peptidyl-prolyl cis-trans isomerase [Phycisphaerae bacterium]
MVALILASLASWGLGGCSSGSGVASAVKPATKPITAAEFGSPTAAAGPQEVAKSPPAEAEFERPARPLRTGPFAASEGLLDVDVEPGEPALGARTPDPVGEPVFVDAKVGDVNNRAIYASAFLNDMIDRLKAKYEEMYKANPRMAKQAWRKFASEQIQQKLDGIIEDEVLRAEALNALQPEQKAGFFNWLQAVRSEVVAENRGIEAAANENLSAQNGTSLDQTMKNREQQELIKFVLQTRIYSRANVSWRDIQIAYEKNYDLFNPPPIASFRIFTVSERDTKEIEKVRAELEGGKDFDDIADEKTRSVDEKDKFLDRPYEGEYAEADLLGPKELNEEVRKLVPGRWVGPIAFRGSMYWIKLERIWKVSEDLYAAQLFLENRLAQTKNDYEKYKFVDRLKKRASYTDVDVMTARLLALAEDRVFGINGGTGSGKGGASPSAPKAR